MTGHFQRSKKMLTSKDFYIVNDFDLPCPNSITVNTEKGLCYLDRDKKRYDGMSFRRPTSLEEFGFVVKAEEIFNGAVFTFVKQNKSTATYENGTNRRWQGATIFSIFVEWDFYDKILQ